MTNTALSFERSSFLILDGAMGTQLQKAGLAAGELPELLNLTAPEIISQIHLDYLRAGADIIYANSFGVNHLKLKGSSHSVEEVVEAALRLAQDACRRVEAETPGRRCYVALDLGPSGKLLEPIGELRFEDSVALYAEIVRAGAALADCIVIETMTDLYELKAAVLAAKENSQLPVMATVALDEGGRMLSGGGIDAVIALLEGLRVDALGLNCGADPRLLDGPIRLLCEQASIPIILKLNAGLPTEKDGHIVYDMSAAEFATQMTSYAAHGVQILGACCGSAPEHIRALKQALTAQKFQRPRPYNGTVLCSYGQTLHVDRQLLIGERINPTGKKQMKEALRSHNVSWMRKQAILQEQQGAHLLDINVGLPEIDEGSMMRDVVRAVQEVTALPLQIDATDPKVLEQGLRAINGKAMINSVNATAESLAQILPLVAKYGGIIVGLTIDDSGIPETAAGRLHIARKIVAACENYGIPRKDIVIDPLCLTVSADSQAAQTSLEALRLIKDELGVKTLLGISNISFGLPNRQLLNAFFFSLALQNGLDFAIMNPGSEIMRAAYDSYRVLAGLDWGAQDYIARQAAEPQAVEAGLVSSQPPMQEKVLCSLRQAIVKGLRDEAVQLTRELLTSYDPLDLMNEALIPALNEVGADFGSGKAFLPQLMMSADATTAAFAEIRRLLPEDMEIKQEAACIVLATVKGDIHDLGKNIVRVLLENYGFRVVDLGKDVSHESIIENCLRENCRLVGLSALMTTTVASMRECISRLRVACPQTKIMVGGAVLNAQYAEQIGADFYGKDAMDAVRYAQELFQDQKNAQKGGS